MHANSRFALQHDGCLPLLLALTMLMSSGTTNLQGQELHRLRSRALRAAAEQVAPSVVQIETFGGLEKVGRLLIGTGPTTGLIVGEDGYIVSSAFNFIQKPSSTLVTLASGDRYPAEIVARDRSRMLVLLKIDSKDPLPVPNFVPRTEFRIGQTAVAVGRTYNRNSVNLSAGILSAVDRIWGRAVQDRRQRFTGELWRPTG